MEPEPVPQAAPEPEATPEPEPASEPQQDNDIPLVQELVDQPAPVEADEVESDLPDATTAGEEPEQDVPEILGEFKQVEAPLEESSQVELTKDELGRLEDLGEHFLDTKEVKKSISLIADMDQGIKEREYQFDELLSLMMKKELGEITQELFMNELGELKKKVDESRKKK